MFIQRTMHNWTCVKTKQRGAQSNFAITYNIEIALNSKQYVVPEEWF